MHKEIAFAEVVREKNIYIKQGYVLYFVLYLSWMLGINLVLDYQLKDSGDRVGGVLLLFGMVLLLLLFSRQYIKSFFSLIGKKGERSQEVFTVVAYLPFSGQEYGKYVSRQMRSWQWYIFWITVVVNGLGMLIFVRHDSYPIYLWETQVTFLDIFVRLVGILLVSLFMAMIPQCVLAWEMAHMKDKSTQREQNKRYFSSKKKSGVQKMEKRLVLAVEVVIVIFLVGCYFVLTDVLHPSLDENKPVYLKLSGIQYIFFFLLASVIDKIYTSLRNWREGELSIQGKRKEIRKLLIVVAAYMVLFFVPQFCYDAYYEDRLEVVRFFHEKTYEWQDVESYEVYHPVLGEEIQLRLMMKDGTNRKVLSGSGLANDRYSDVYESDYGYVESLVEKLDDLGIKGKLTKPEKIEKKIDEDAVNDLSAWKHIRKLVEE